MQSFEWESLIFKSTEGTRARVSLSSFFTVSCTLGVFIFSFSPRVVCPMPGRQKPLQGCFVQEIQHPPKINDLWQLPASVIVVVRKPFVAAPPLQNSNNDDKIICLFIF